MMKEEDGKIGTSSLELHPRRVRVVLRKLRVALALLMAVVLIWFARPEWFWWAVGVALCGECIQLWAASCLEKNLVFRPRGPYTLVRNPMYCGRFLVVLGQLIVLGNPWFLYLAPAYVFVFCYYVIGRVRREEETLAELFGADYVAYREHVPRFFPNPFRPYQVHDSVWSFRWELVTRNHEERNLFGLIFFFVIVQVRLLLG